MFWPKGTAGFHWRICSEWYRPSMVHECNAYYFNWREYCWVSLAQHMKHKVCLFKEHFYGSCCVYKIVLAKSSFELLPQEFCTQADILPFSFFSPHSLLFILRPREGYGRCERRSRPSFSPRPRPDGRRQNVVTQERLGGCQIREDIFIGCCGCKSLS